MRDAASTDAACAEAIRASQRRRAANRGPEVGGTGYPRTVAENPRQPVPPRVLDDIASGAGSELRDRPGRPAKMRALRSSAAPCVNVFGYLADRDAEPLRQTLGFDGRIRRIRFERRFSTGLPGTPPNLDVLLEREGQRTIAIESKFTEWFALKAKAGDPNRKGKAVGKEPFTASYFPPRRELWSARGLPRCQALAVAVRDGDVKFAHLDAPQLLKHALGLAASGAPTELWYLYFDGTCAAAESHRSEIARFAGFVDAALRFRAISYQGLIGSLAASAGPSHARYLEYLATRYLPSAGPRTTRGPSPADADPKQASCERGGLTPQSSESSPPP